MSMETPCKSLCVIDGVTGYCIGCGRTGDEIANWLAMTGDERRGLMALLPARLETMTSREARTGRRRATRTTSGGDLS